MGSGCDPAEISLRPYNPEANSLLWLCAGAILQTGRGDRDRPQPQAQAGAGLQLRHRAPERGRPAVHLPAGDFTWEFVASGFCNGGSHPQECDI